MLKYLVVIALAAVSMTMSTGCNRQNYLMFEDGDFDGIEFSDYDLMHNAELDMDDTDRDWWMQSHGTVGDGWAASPLCKLLFKKY